MRRFISGPTIAALTQTPRMTINYRLRAGRYGPTFFHGRIRYADLAEVEKAVGLQFTETQIELAAQGRPGRVLRIPDQQESDHGPS